MSGYSSQRQPGSYFSFPMLLDHKFSLPFRFLYVLYKSWFLASFFKCQTTTTKSSSTSTKTKHPITILSIENSPSFEGFFWGERTGSDNESESRAMLFLRKDDIGNLLSDQGWVQVKKLLDNL